jgi:hypothetical protein
MIKQLEDNRDNLIKEVRETYKELKQLNTNFTAQQRSKVQAETELSEFMPTPESKELEGEVDEFISTTPAVPLGPVKTAEELAVAQRVRELKAKQDAAKQGDAGDDAGEDAEDANDDEIAEIAEVVTSEATELPSIPTFADYVNSLVLRKTSEDKATFIKFSNDPRLADTIRGKVAEYDPNTNKFRQGWESSKPTLRDLSNVQQAAIEGYYKLEPIEDKDKKKESDLSIEPLLEKNMFWVDNSRPTSKSDDSPMINTKLDNLYQQRVKNLQKQK